MTAHRTHHGAPAGPWRVWATRPAEQNAEWSSLLRERGFAVLELPLLAIDPVTEAAEMQAARNSILEFDQFHKVIFVSQNAVQETFRWLADYWPQLPVGVSYFAVGRKTAEAVQAQGVAVVAAEDTMDTDELLALPQLQSVWGEKILICRGCGGLPRLGRILQERGAIVRYCELYRRRLPDTAETQVRQALAARTERDLVALFSGETLLNFRQTLAEASAFPAALPLVVPGRRVAELATGQGFVDVTQARNASVVAMLDALEARVQADFRKISQEP